MWQTIGQPRALALLEHAVSTGNLAHAYLFVGPSHVGKTTLALDLAQAVNCYADKPPCGECQSCHRIANGKHADISIIGLDSPTGSREAKSWSEIGIEEIRGLQRSVSLPPYEGKYKVFVIEGAEYLSTEAANSLLKILEEPPPTVILILLTVDALQLLPTVVSRCQQLELRPISWRDVEKVLTQYRGVDSHKAKLLARVSGGCLGWALKASVDDGYLAQRTQRLSDMHSLLSANVEERFTHAAQFGKDRQSAEQVVRLWLTWWRDIMLTKCGAKEAITNIDYSSILEEWGQALSLLQTKDFVNTLQESLSQISRNANLQLLFETLMLDMPREEGQPGRVTPSRSVGS